MRFIVAYDIDADRRRMSCAHTLLHCGVRLQRSVYDLQLEPTEVERVLDSLRQHLDLRTDVLQAFAQCESCAERRVDLGQVKQTLDLICWIV